MEVAPRCKLLTPLTLLALFTLLTLLLWPTLSTWFTQLCQNCHLVTNIQMRKKVFVANCKFANMRN